MFIACIPLSAVWKAPHVHSLHPTLFCVGSTNICLLPLCCSSRRHSWTHLKHNRLLRVTDWVLWIDDQRHTWMRLSYSWLWLNRATVGCREQKRYSHGGYPSQSSWNHSPFYDSGPLMREADANISKVASGLSPLLWLVGLALFVLGLISLPNSSLATH